MEKEDIQAIVEKVVSTLNETKPEAQEVKAEPQEAPTNNTNDKVVIDLQKSYEKLSGQLDEINRKLTEKQEVKATTEKKPLVIQERKNYVRCFTKFNRNCCGNESRKSRRSIIH